MSNPKGGIADKEGNRYEKWAVISKYIELLENKIDYVIVEKLGQRHADFICKKGDEIYKYQAKARKGNILVWDFQSLKSILKNAKEDLGKGENFQRFILFSPISEIDYHDMAKGLRNHGLSLFYKDQIEGNTSNKPKFNRIKEEFFTSGNDNEDISDTLDFISRFESHTMGDDQNTKGLLIRSLGLLLLGEPSSAFSILYEFIDESFGKKVTYDIITDYLEEKGFKSRAASSKNDIQLVKEKAQSYLSKYRERLLDENLYSREYTQQIIDSLNEGNDILLTGSAGVGKSGTIFDLIQTLSKTHLVFPINVNDETIGDNIKQMSTAFGFENRLDYVLHDIKSEKEIIVIIDQLDTAKMLNANKGNVYSTIKNFIESLDFIRGKESRVKILITCRSFDLENDPSLKQLTDEYTIINLAPLSEKDLTEILSKKGIAYKTLPKETQKLIGTFFHLKLFLKVYDKSKPHRYATKLDLMGEYIRKLESSFPEIRNALLSFANALIMRKETSRHKDKIGCTEKELNILKSAGVFSEKGDFISFEHQSFLDYFSSLDLSERLENNIENLLNWLGDKDDQTLAKAVIFSNALQMITDKMLIDVSKAILPSQGIRYHIKHTLLSFLSTKEDPVQQLEEYIYQLAIHPNYQKIIFNRVFYQDRYISTLISSGKLEELLSNGNFLALNVISNTLRRADKYTDFILSYVFPNKPEAIYEHYQYDLEKMPIALMDSFISHAPETYSIIEYMHLNTSDELVNICSLCAKALAKTAYQPSNNEYKNKIIDNEDFCFPLKMEFHRIPTNSIDATVDNTSKEQLTACFETLIAPLVELFSTIPEEKIFTINTDRDAVEDKDIIENSYFLLKHIGRKILTLDEDFIMKHFRAYCSSMHPYIKILFFEIMDGISKPENANYIVNWLTEKKLSYDDLHSITIRNNCHFTGRLIEKISHLCSRETLREIQEMVLSTKPYMYYKSIGDKEQEDHYLKYYKGEAQFLLLSKLPKKRLIKPAKEALKIATEGYGSNNHYYEPMDFKMRKVVSPFHKRDATTEEWLKVITDQNLKEEDRLSEREKDSEYYYEHSVRAYSSDFQDAVIKQPNRFLKLTQDHTEQVRPEFIESIFSALEKYSNRDVKEEIDYKLMKSFIINYFDINNDNISKSFCNITKHRYSDDLPVCFLYALPEIAMHKPQKAIDIHNTDLDNEEAPAESIEHAAYNSARGEAFYTMSSLLFINHNLFSIFEPAIRQGIEDPQPAVRMAVMSCVAAAYNIDKELSLQMFRQLIQEDYKPALSSYGSEYVNVIVSEQPEIFRDIYYRILKSDNEKEIVNITYGATAYEIFYGHFEDLVEASLSHSEQARRGVLKGVRQCLSEYYDKTIRWLEKLLEYQDTDFDKFARLHLKEITEDHLKDFLGRLSNGQITIKLLPYIIDSIIDGGISWSDCIVEIQLCIIEYLNTPNQNERPYVISEFFENITTLIKGMYDHYSLSKNKGQISFILDIWDEMLKQQNRAYTDMHNKLMQEMN